MALIRFREPTTKKCGSQRVVNCHLEPILNRLQLIDLLFYVSKPRRPDQCTRFGWQTWKYLSTGRSCLSTNYGLIFVGRSSPMRDTVGPISGERFPFSMLPLVESRATGSVANSRDWHHRLGVPVVISLRKDIRIVPVQHTFRSTRFPD